MNYSHINHQELEQSRGLKEYIQTLAEKFLTTLNLSHIWLSKEYFDGRYLELTNDLSWKKIMLTHNHIGDFAEKFYTTLRGDIHTPQFFVWQSEPSQENDLIDRTYRYGLHSGFNIIFMQDDHLENYGFGTSQELTNLFHTLPSRTELEMFCLYLRENVFKSDILSSLIFGNTGQPFSPSQTQKDYSSAFIPSSFSFQCNNREAKLSRRELICLGLLARGYSQKDAGKLLHVSPRTIEFHLIQVKKKFLNPSTSDLITQFNDSIFGNIDPLLLSKTE